MMMVSDEQGRWIVVGIAMHKVVSPIILEVVKDGMDTTLANLDAYCSSSLSPPCVSKTLNYIQVNNNSMLKKLWFQNINNNHLQVDKKGNLCKNAFNYNVKISVDLAKILLPPHLAHFSAFDDSLDMSASLRLLGCTRVVPEPFAVPIRDSADDVRDNVRNKWGHFNPREWSEAFFNDCFIKMETLVSNLGLNASVEKKTLDQLTDWKTKGCSLCMGHAVDKDLLILVQQELKRLIEDHTFIKLKLSGLEDEEGKLQRKEAEEILHNLRSCLGGILMRLDALEEGLAKTDKRVEQLEKRHTVDPGRSPLKPFDLELCRSELAEHYKATATVPTSGWSTKASVDIHQMYTRLSWVKREETPAGPSLCELTHFSDLFKADMNGVAPKRILVQGHMGIGKSTFVKKLAVDWAELAKLERKQSAALKKFELVIAIDLREVSECQDLGDVIRCSSIFAEESKFLTEGLLNYITSNQENVLLVFDGYEEYHGGSKSDVYEIFIGKKLRNCCVLITTQIYKADQLLNSKLKVTRAEITGFHRDDIETFLKKLLKNKKSARYLWSHLCECDLQDLAKVPLILLFFVTLLKEQQFDSFPDTKTELFLAIVQYVLDSIQGKNYPDHYREVHDFRDALCRIGEVALRCLLKKDHVFGRNELSAAICCEENPITGLFQVTEYTESLRPAKMVSFIHGRIQQFLAAWFISYKCCFFKGNLGPLADHVNTLEDCEALQSVFHFICGLTDEGAQAVFKHWIQIRGSDCSLKVDTVPDEERGTDVPLNGVTKRHQRFNDLVFHSFREVKSKESISKHFCDSVGRNVLVTKPSFHHPLTTMDLKTCFLFGGPPLCIRRSNQQVKTLQEWLKFLDKKNARLENLDQFVHKFLTINAECHSEQLRGSCGFNSCLCFRNNNVFIYITDLHLTCSTHADLFFETAQNTDRLFSLKFLRTLTVFSYIKTLRDGEVFGNCKHLNHIECCDSGGFLCDILKQLPNPGTCSLKIGTFDKCSLSVVYSLSSSLTLYLESDRTLQFAEVLKRFENTISLALDVTECSEAEVITLLSSIPHMKLVKLRLKGINIERSIAVALGKLLPEISSLEALELVGKGLPDKSVTVNLEDLFCGFEKNSPLKELYLCSFNCRGSLSALTKIICFFPDLVWLNLEALNLDESDLNDLMKSFNFLSNIQELSLRDNPLSCPVQVLANSITKMENLGSLWLAGTHWSDQEQIEFVELVSESFSKLDVLWQNKP